MNSTCLMKLGWDIKVGRPSLWSDVIRGEYMHRGGVDYSVVAKGYDSSLWKALVQLWPKMDKHAFWVVGNDRSTLSWHSRWFNEDLCVGDLNVAIPANVCDNGS